MDGIDTSGDHASLARAIVEEAHDKIDRWTEAAAPVAEGTQLGRACGIMLVHLMDIAREQGGPDLVHELMRAIASYGTILLDRDGALEAKLGREITAAANNCERQA